MDDGCTEFRLPIAAVAQQEQDQLPDGCQLHPVDHAAAVPHHRDEAGTGQNAEVGGHGIVRYIKTPGDFARRQAIRLLLHQQPEHVESRGLGESRKAVNGEIIFHMSGFVDMLCDEQVTIFSMHVGLVVPRGFTVNGQRVPPSHMPVASAVQQTYQYLFRFWKDCSRTSHQVKAIALRHIATLQADIRKLICLRDVASHLAGLCHSNENPGFLILDGLCAWSKNHSFSDLHRNGHDYSILLLPDIDRHDRGRIR